MKPTERINLLILFVCIFILHTVQSQTINIGDIPQSRNIISGWEDIQFDESGTWTTVDVTTKGVVPNTGADMGPSIQSMIMAGTGKTIYKFPAGEYKIDTMVRISKGDFQIIGEGSATKFLLRGGTNPPMLIIEGARAGGAQKLQTAINRGDDKITLVNVSGLEVGDFIFIKQSNGERSFDIDTQIVKILAINGNTLTLDMKIGLPFTVDKASIEKLAMLKNVKLSEFYIEQVSVPDVREGKLRLAYIYNGLISHVESNKTLAQHIEINDSRNVLLFQNNIYGNYGHDQEGGYQGGIVLNRCTRVNIINNRLHDLRHHIALQFGSSFCVIAYNRTSKHNDYGDYGQHNSKGCHNNLFEGNYGSELYDDWNIKAWGSPYAMWFRNHAVNKIGTEYLGQMHMTIIGNELRVGEIGLKLAAPENDNFVAANIVSIDKENGIGTMLWGNLPANATIPNSLFLTEKPAYLDKWPLYGPGTEGTGTKEPVDQPKDIIYKETVLPEGFTYATEEKVTVKVTGLMDIAFGTPGSYHILYNQNADLVCGTAVFNDPAPGVKKQCFTRNSATTNNESINFTILTKGESCKDKKNGLIEIQATKSLNYVATFNGIDYSFTSNKTIEGLSPGAYDLCISTLDKSFEQCYKVSIAGGTNLSGKISVTNKRATVAVLKGTAPYTVYKNGVAMFDTYESNFSVDTNYGDMLEVKSKLFCEGVISKSIDLMYDVKAYPNPSNGLFEIYIPTSLNEIAIEVYNTLSQLVDSKTYPVISGKVSLNIIDKPNGVYFVKLKGEKSVFIKVVKE